MKTRVITAAVGLAVLAIVLAFFNTVLFDLVLSAVCLIAVHEVFTAMGFGKKQWYLYAVAIPFTLMVMLTTTQVARLLVLPVSFLVVLFFNICQIVHLRTLDFGKLTGYVYFSGVIIFCFYSLIHLKRVLPFELYHYDAVYFILLILCFAWGGDTAAYFAGRAFGKHKLAPLVSPKKTVEGAVGGVLGSILAGVLLTGAYMALSGHYDVITLQVRPRHYLILVLLGAIASVLGILGDLFASAVKRQVGLKDYGTIFPGHGGILDRFDSVMFIAPFVAIVVRYFFYLF
ncbi:MAG TPA: phosphatidate cytidylyltransferase [Candidatus Gemmiger excrementavium]|uniref:Phosphatidate cytidylyltransferase n=1 Tax=Candidatus Gemmiger excrementavium TaxID=2838608 RepID=A0A9D2F200_9FIRM|nr:phosphatidate cytidylyltransferase [Candidatus Gemmiger excrementavium]